MRDLTFGVVCLGIGRAAPDVEDSASFVDGRYPGEVGDGGGMEDGGRDGDLRTDGGIFEFPEAAGCSIEELSTASP